MDHMRSQVQTIPTGGNSFLLNFFFALPYINLYCQRCQLSIIKGKPQCPNCFLWGQYPFRVMTTLSVSFSNHIDDCNDIDSSINADAEADTDFRCGQGLRIDRKVKGISSKYIV